MTITFNKHILSIFFCAFALIALSACGGSSGGGGGGGASCDNAVKFCDTPDKIVRADCAALGTHDCMTGLLLTGGGGGGGEMPTCDDSLKFCGIGDEITRDTAICATNNAVTTNNKYDCSTGELTCDNTANFCHSTEALRDSCNPRTHNCGLNNQGTGSARPILDPADPSDSDATIIYVTAPDSPPTVTTAADTARATYTAPDDTDMATNTNRGTYNTVPAGATIAQAVAKIQAVDEYQATGGADQIHAAYAYARGYSGDKGDEDNLLPIIISSMSSAPLSDHGEISNQILRSDSDSNTFKGYTAHSSDSTNNAGVCSGSLSVPCADNLGTHLAGIMVAGAGDRGLQGIAYRALLKPINIYKMDGSIVDNANLIAAIGEASGMESYRDPGESVTKTARITVMNNGWDVSGVGTYTETVMGTDYTRYYKTANRVSTITDTEAEAWKEAVKTTVVVFGAGDYGHNSENGKVQLYSDNNLGAEAKAIRADGMMLTDTDRDRLAWSAIDSENRNIASSHARLPLEVEQLRGKWLTVIALDENDRIADFSNGCGDAMAYCLGAPGVAINSLITTSATPAPMKGTAQAAAHVSGAIAVLASSFPTSAPATPEELVAIILNTADYLRKTGDSATDGTNDVYGHGALNLGAATAPLGRAMTTLPDGLSLGADASLDNSGITLPTSFGSSLDGFTVGFIDDYKRAYIGNPERITRENAAFTLGDTLATWESPELQSIALDSNSKMQFTNYDENEDAKDTLIFTHKNANHTVGFSYNEESKTPDLRLAGTGEELHFQKIRPIANDLMQLNSTYKLGKAWNVKNAITSGEFDTGNRFNEAMANLSYTGENRNLTIGAGTLKEYGQFLGASGTGAYQLSDATSSQVTHLAISQNLPRNSAIKLKYTNFKTEVDMRYSNFANINDLTANEYQLSFGKRKVWGKNDSLNLELIQPFAVTDGTLQQSTVLGYNEAGDYNNVTQNYSLKPETRRQQIRMTWQNQLNHKNKTKLFISMQYENHVDNLRDNEESSVIGGLSTRF